MRTKEEILHREMMKVFPEMTFIGVEFRNQAWFDAAINAMDEWHKECLPTDAEMEDFLQAGYRNLYYSTREGIRWCRDFKREEKQSHEVKMMGVIFSEGKNDNIEVNMPNGYGYILVSDEDQTPYPAYVCNNYLHRTDSSKGFPRGGYRIFKEKVKETKGNFVWDGKDSVKFIPDENGSVTVINNSK